MKKLFCIVWGILFTSCISAQLENINWVCPDSVGLNFTTGEPMYFGSSMLGLESTTSISDKEGNLLFYSNGEKVWDRNNSLMPNGDSLSIGLVGDLGSSITQGVIIIPKPLSDSLFYIFQLQKQYSPEINGLMYSIIDLSLNGGFGDVVEKNIALFDKSLTEKMQAVKHGNGKDWWLIMHAWPDLTLMSDSTMVFTLFLITSFGIEGPFEQAYGIKAYEADNPYLGWGEMVINEEGDIIVYVRRNKVDIYDFDRCNGLMSNLRTITNLPNTLHYGCSISPNNNFVYVSSVGDDQSYLYQFEIKPYINIDSTKEVVYHNQYNNYALGQHELGPDGKIYISMYYYKYWPNTIYSEKNKNLCVINEPNLKYPYCDFDTNSISLGSGRTIGSLPNMPNYRLGALQGSECDTLNTSIQEPEIQETFFTVYPNPATDYLYIETTTQEQLNLIIRDVKGSVCMQINHLGDEPIHVSHLTAGLYSVIAVGVQSGKVYNDTFVKI